MERIARLIEETDIFHLPGPLEPGAAWYKEWLHFCVVTPEVDLVVNLNLSGDTRPAAPLDSRVARVIVLAAGEVWEGAVDTIPARDVSVHPARVDLRFGHNVARFRDGYFELSAALQDRPVALALRLRPAALPLLVRNNTPIGAGTINWLVVPRLFASGTLTVGTRVHTLSEAPAYHDHNWGRWLWGHDFAWEWGFGLPDRVEMPWSVVFDRTTNRARSQALELTLALWKGEALHRVFTQHEVTVRASGLLAPRRVPKFPRVMTLIAPEATPDIPARLDLFAAAGRDHLHCAFIPESVAQIVIPNDTDLGITIINEVPGRLLLEGEVRGERVAAEGRGIFEFLTC